MPQHATAPGTPLRGHGWTVRAHLLLILLTAVGLVAGALGYGYAWGVERAEDEATARMRAQAQAGARDIADDLAEVSAQLDGLARQDVSDVRDPRDGCALVPGGSRSFAVSRLDVVRRDGSIACSSDRDVAEPGAVPHATARWLRRALSARRATVMWPAVDRVTARRAVVVARSFAADDPDGAVGDPAGGGGAAGPGTGGGPAPGAVVQVLATDAVASVLADELVLPDHAGVVVVDRVTGEVVSASHPALAGRAAAGGELEQGGRWVGADGRLRVVASADVGVVPWRVYAALDHDRVTAAARGTLVRQGLTATVALLALVLALAVLERRVAGPLMSLTRVALRARDDAGSVRVPEAGTAELAALARAFNSMLDIRAGQEARLAYGASHDGLTALPNTAAFRTAVDAALAREPRPAVTVLCVGLDRFQSLRDGLGTEGADRVLVEVALRLRATVRPGDTVARGDGERFFVAAEELSRAEAVDLAERIHLAVEEPMGWAAGGVVVRASTGIAVSTPGCVADDLVRRSLTAMGDAQARGRTWSTFDDSMHVLAAHQLQTENGLRDALVHDRLVVHYQPIVEMDTGRLVGAEALVRWMHPERGVVGPLEFIGVAERTGQIHAIGRLVLRRACAQAVRWADPDGPFTMSVNVAAAQLLDDGFADVVASVLAETGLPAARLCLEVTESAVIRRAGSGADNLHRLRAMGVHVAVDDFGTGYSSLSYLKNLPITSLKIDRSFITRIEHDARDRHLVAAVLGMARALGLTVVAEGVETAGQRRLLEDLGCGSAQGYLFGRPCATDDFSALVGDEAARSAP